jgi:hypothetical protein
MTKRELIEALDLLNCGDDTPVITGFAVLGNTHLLAAAVDSAILHSEAKFIIMKGEPVAYNGEYIKLS